MTLAVYADTPCKLGDAHATLKTYLIQNYERTLAAIRAVTELQCFRCN